MKASIFGRGGGEVGSIVRVKEIQICNLKNVKQGTFKTNSHFDDLEQADIIGFYGQNGSGKTAVVEAFSLLKNLLSTSLVGESLPKKSKNLLYAGQQYLQLTVQFMILNDLGKFYAKYDVVLEVVHDRLQVIHETLSYRENVKGRKYKDIISKSQDVLKIRTHTVHKLCQNDRVTLLVAERMASTNYTSFVFREELQEIYAKHLDEQEVTIIYNLSRDFVRDLHIIDHIQYGLLIANITMPFTVHLEDKRGSIPTEMHDTMLLSKPMYQTIQEVIVQTNIVLAAIIPGLNIKINVISEQKLRSGEDGIRIEFLSQRNDTELPLRFESEGILKMISILSTLIAVFNNPNTCVVIDELDAGVFEYLLGELLLVLNEGGKGQLFFTSHNLRVLEVLPVSCIWFTTTNEEQRYIQLKGIKKPHNIRDAYLRAVQIGGQEESLYEETSLYDIKRCFRKAGSQIE